MLDLKIFMYRNADEINKLRKIKADYDKQMVEALQQVKSLSSSKTALQQELEELKVAAQAVVDVVEIPETLQRSRSPWWGSCRRFLSVSCRMSQ